MENKYISVRFISLSSEQELQFLNDMLSIVGVSFSFTEDGIPEINIDPDKLDSANRMLKREGRHRIELPLHGEELRKYVAENGVSKTAHEYGVSIRTLKRRLQEDIASEE